MATASPAHPAAGPAVGIRNGVTQPVFSYAEAIREFAMVQSPVDSDGDGRKDLIRADIVRPKETGDGLRVPVILHASPYFDTGLGWQRETKSYDQSGNATKIPLFLDNYFVPRGYAVVSVDMTGTAKSGGCPTGGGASDVLGAKAVVDWLNGRAPAYDESGEPVRAASWTTGRTGMIGMSYDGLLATGVAGTGVPGLATVVPIAQGSSVYEMSRAGGTISWIRDGLAQISAMIDKDPPEKCAQVRKQLTEGVDDETGNYNAFWHERNYRSGPVADVRNVRASVLAVMGVNDLNVKPSQLSLWWDGLAKRGVPRKLWLTQYGHTDPFDFRREQWVSTLHRWFDHELQGIDNGILRQPRVDVQLGPDRWITQPDWPAPAARTLTLRPGGDGSLGTRPSQGRGSYTDALLPEADLIADPGAARPYRLAYLAPALKQDLRLSGTPQVSLKLSADRPAANVSALLVDYGRDTRVNPAYGIRRAPGEDCVGEGTPEDSGCFWRWADDTVTTDAHVVGRGTLDAQNRTSLSASLPLTPGKSYRVTWSLQPTDHLLKAGHRLGLILAGTDAELAAAETPTGAKVTVDLGGSTISVPVVATAP
ncbi:Xaa-Pro dipeptidyl-peptidase [Nonomuraea typhae]|uniref:Xaa-Pro dipeptidyl-peptidase n=1 Tax=Nonomuraea typhae TaxID=2603600 RepID=UPI001C67A56D|nr:Xaa-Pro dipeptidyl-peptidase [Nonomuraea typhae]